MTAQSAERNRSVDRPSRPNLPPVLIIGRIAAVFLTALGVVHAIVNTVGFAQLGFGPWVDYLIFGIGLSMIAFALAVVAWRLAASRCAPWPGIIFLLIGGLLLLLQLAGIATTDPALLIRPLGPGPWSLIGGPALVIEAGMLAAGRIRNGSSR